MVDDGVEGGLGADVLFGSEVVVGVVFGGDEEVNDDVDGFKTGGRHYRKPP